MLKGIQTAVAVLILTCLLGVSSAHARSSSKQLISLDLLQTSCRTSPEEFLYALRFGPKLGSKDSNKSSSAVFASSKNTESHFQTQITAKIDGGETIVETTATAPVASISPATVSSNVVSVPVNGALDPGVLFSMANSHRAGLGLPPFEKDGRVCAIAQGRSPELNVEMANGTMHSGLFGDNHPFWVTENMISMRSNEEAFNWWLNSPVHRGQLQGNFKYACAACDGNTCALVFTNFTSK